MPALHKQALRLSAATTNATSLTAAATVLYSYDIGNNGAADAYVKLYDTAIAPTAGAGTPVRVIYVPKGARVSAYLGESGVAFLNGIGFTITGGAAHTDTTAVLLNQVLVNVEYL